MKLLDLEQNSPLWEEYRRSHIGASDIGILMEGTEREVYELLQNKRGLAKKFVTDAMQRGTEMEAEAIEWLIGNPNHEKICALHDAPDDWLMASFDYYDQSIKVGAEIKCPKVVLNTPTQHSHYKRWVWQMQAQMCVSGLDSWELVVYSPTKRLREVIFRDESAIAALKEKGRWFFKVMTEFQELPSPSELAEREDDEARDWSSLFKQIDDKIKELQEAKDVLRDEGIAMAGDTPFVCNGVKVQRIENKPKPDYEAACKAHKIDTAQYMKDPKSPYTWRVLQS